MLKIMLVDDEVNILEGLRISIDWESLGCQVICDARNGEEGLKKAQDYHPDIIITDITMPVLDGLNMMEMIKGKNPEIKFILLTCHEDFHYAKKAVNLSAEGYITKETMTREELAKIIHKIIKQVDDEKKIKEQLSGAYKELNETKNKAVESIINDLLEKSDDDRISLMERLKIYGYSFNMDFFILSVVKIDNYLDLIGLNSSHNIIRVKSSIIGKITEILEAHGLGKAFYKEGNEFVIIYNFIYNIKHSIVDEIRDISKEIQKSLKDSINITCTIFIGKQIHSIEDLPAAYKTVKALENTGFYMRDGAIVEYLHAENSENNLDYDAEKLIVKEFENALYEYDTQGLKLRINKFFTDMIKNQISRVRVEEVIERMFIIIINLLEKNNQKHQDIVGDYVGIIKYAGNIYELQDKLLEVSEKTIELLKHDYVFYTLPVINKTVKYVKANFRDNISLDTVASNANMNSSYFSRYFKSKTGENFVDFLARIRIEKAKELLIETELSIEEIAELVGYGNKSYFTKIFKKVTKVNPGEFRRSIYEK